jgi:hypothetical protein
MQCADEEDETNDMTDAFGSSWTAIFASLSFMDELGGAVANPATWTIVAVVVVAAIFSGWLFTRYRALTVELRGLTNTLHEADELRWSVVGEMLDERRGLRRIARPDCGEYADNIADKVPADAAEKNPRKSSQKIPRKARENADIAPACVQAFVDQRVVRRQGGKLTPTDFHSAYSAWCEEEGFTPVTPNKFGRALTDIGLPKDGRHYLNIGLRGSKLKVVRA